MNLPIRTKVGPVTYATRIQKMREVEDGHLNGEVIYNTLEIQVSEDIAAERQLHTYVHELTHAICNEAGLGMHRDDEDFVSRFSSVLTQVIVDNGWSF